MIVLQDVVRIEVIPESLPDPFGIPFIPSVDSLRLRILVNVTTPTATNPSSAAATMTRNIPPATPPSAPIATSPARTAVIRARKKLSRVSPDCSCFQKESAKERYSSRRKSLAAVSGLSSALVIIFLPIFRHGG